MKTHQELEKMRRRLARLAAGLSRIGLIAQGTITNRTIEREDKNQPGKTKTYGPYYQWTFKDQGKTVTINLSKAQAPRFKRAIENHRHLESIVAQLRELSLRILENSTKGVKNRKSSR